MSAVKRLSRIGLTSNSLEEYDHVEGLQGQIDYCYYLIYEARR